MKFGISVRDDQCKHLPIHQKPRYATAHYTLIATVQLRITFNYVFHKLYYNGKTRSKSERNIPP